MKTLSSIRSITGSRLHRASLTAVAIVALPILFTSIQLPAQTTAPATTAAQPWTKIPIPPLNAFKPAQPRRVELPNGLIIFLQEDHELPFINGSILIRGGSRDVPDNKVGLVSLYGETWRTSGTATIDGDKLDDVLEAKAASIETGGGIASTTLTWSSLKGDFDTVFASAVDLLLHPTFKADKLTLAKEQSYTSISRRNDDASAISIREAIQIAYGPHNPYARQSEYATIASVTLDDLKAWHDRTVVPANLIVSISGDFNAADMERKLRAAFESLPAGKKFVSEKVTFTNPKPGVNFVEKSDVDQSNVLIVGLGTERSNPDYYALSVMNEIFSGGFGSRVVQNVRTKLGLAYEVGGSFSASYDHPGIFYVQAATKSATTVAATQALLAEIDRLKTEPPTPAELSKAKDQVLNSFIFHYDSPDKTLNEQVTLAFYGYPADTLEKYKSGIEKVTSADVSRVANKYIDTSKLATVIVGNESEITPKLDGLGKVTNVDITIPPPPGKPTE
ncbi:pitrilysin family protein [Granulicella sp. L60]|uniref:M16 family metallopeptidase n=1 Tax=Granulicella sp. L60 TaxID=1641866 RepID=UPI00131B6634|nr:pitrilysin family protein [Granulicella sp. L60]